MLVGGCDEAENEPEWHRNRQIALIQQRGRQVRPADLHVEGRRPAETLGGDVRRRQESAVPRHQVQKRILPPVTEIQ